MSLWEYQCAVEGFVKAHGSQKARPPTDEEHQARVLASEMRDLERSANGQ